VLRHVDPLEEQQQAAVCDVQQSARRVEEALDGDLGTLLRSLSEVVSSDPQPPAMYGQQVYHPAADVARYMGQQMHMVVAMDKLAALGTFLRQASDCFSSLFILLGRSTYSHFRHACLTYIYMCVCVCALESNQKKKTGRRAADAHAASAPAGADGEAGGAVLRRHR
jgi:hypothetical protein